MTVYKNVYKNENGILVQNTENKIEYVDKNGKRRIKTNPTFNDFQKIGYLRKKYVSELPEYDPLTQYVEESFVEKDGFFEISYIIKEKEVINNEENN